MVRPQSDDSRGERAVREASRDAAADPEATRSPADQAGDYDGTAPDRVEPADEPVRQAVDRGRRLFIPEAEGTE